SLWSDLAFRKHLCTLSGYHDRTIFSVHWSREGIIASGAADDAIRFFAETKDSAVDGSSYSLLLKKEKAHDMDVNVVEWSPAVRFLLDVLVKFHTSRSLIILKVVVS
ncbi:Protein CIA1, partial [Linum grandiflorum]